MHEDLFNPLEAANRQRSLILKIVRLAFFILIVTVVLVTIINEAQVQGSDRAGVSTAFSIWYLPLIIALALFAVAFLIDILTPNKKIATLGGVFLGLFAGVLGAVAMSFLVDLVASVTLDEPTLKELNASIDLIKLMLGISLCYLAIVTVLQTQDDFRLVIPYVEFSKQTRGIKPFLLDTSALIDARIVELAATGLIQSTLIIPKFVILELQALSDSTDRLKRAKGRRGLDAVTRLQRAARVDVAIEDSQPVASGVDQALVELAQQLSARILTTDLGLTRVGQIHGVTVLNLHEIAGTLRASLVPGEQISLTLSKPGEQTAQAVGYLDDGTMVVVDHAAHRIGQQVFALVSSTMQTGAGRLVFAKLLEVHSPPSSAGPAESTSDSPGDFPHPAPPDAPTGDTLGSRAAHDDDALTPGAPAPAGPTTPVPSRPSAPPPNSGRKIPTGRNPRR